MRKVLFLLSPGTASSMEELVAACDFSASSVQGVLLRESHESDNTFSFPCYTLESGKTKADSPSVQYSGMLKMIFEADTVIS